jgi:WD40 repeat protein
VEAVPGPSQRDWWDIAWSPDGRQVAVPTFDTPCKVDLFDISLAPASLRLTRTLAVPELPNKHYCKVVWSPDGRQLALSAGLLRSHDFVVHLQALPALGPAGASVPILTLSTASTPDAISSLGVYDGSYLDGAAWLSDASELIIKNDAHTLIARGVKGPSSHTVLYVPDKQGSRLCAITNVAQTTLLAFTYCYLYTVDGPNLKSGPGERLYIFDPAAA